MFLSAAHITKWLWICPLSTWVEQTKAYLFSKVRSINSRPILWASSGVTSSVGMQWSYALLWWRDMGMLQLWLHWRVLKESCKWNFQFGPLLWVLNLIENNVLEGGFKWTPFWTPRMVQSLRLYHFLCPNEMIWTSSKRNPKIIGATLRNVNEYWKYRIIHLDYNVNLNIDKWWFPSYNRY